MEKTIVNRKYRFVPNWFGGYTISVYNEKHKAWFVTNISKSVSVEEGCRIIEHWNTEELYYVLDDNGQMIYTKEEDLGIE